MNLTILLNGMQQKAQIVGIIMGTFWSSLLIGTVFNKMPIHAKGLIYIGCVLYSQFRIDRAVVDKNFDILYPLFSRDRMRMMRQQEKDRVLLMDHGLFIDY